MLLWLGFAVLAAAVTWAVTRPLFASRSRATAAPDTELAVYRDQLAEIERERAQGLIAGGDAEAARVEVARRLIRSAEEAEGDASKEDAQASGVRRAVILAAAAIPVFTLGIYLAVGSPTLPGRPYAERLDTPVAQATANDLIAKVEAHLRTNPDDGRGWDVLAPVYMRMGAYQQAADAYERALRLLGDSPLRLAGLARATIMVDNGVVGEPARRAYEKLRALEPDALEPQVWLAIAKEQDGDIAGAVNDYGKLLTKEGASEEPWKSLLNQRLLEAAGKLEAAKAPAAKAPRGPDAESAAAFHAMPAEQREKFIEQMVAGLADRLKTNGKDLNGWMQLMRSYVVLGRTEDANNALADARNNFAGDENALAQLQALADVLGIGS